MSLKDSTPARVAGIKFPFRNWKDICEQPFEVTARIPMREAEMLPDDALVTKAVHRVVRRKMPTNRVKASKPKPECRRGDGATVVGGIRP